MSTSLARDMDRVAVTPERVRAGAIQIVDAVIASCSAVVPVVRAAHIGGDSWFIETATLEQALQFGVLLLRAFEAKTTQGYYYLKPSLATGYGEPKLLNGKFLDDASIATYRAADAGKPFRYELVGEAVSVACQYPWVVQATEVADDRTINVLEWRSSEPSADANPAETQVVLPQLLLDSEVLYSSTPAEALNVIQRHQAAAKVVHAFGGPVPLSSPLYRAYVKNSISLIREPAGPSLVVLSYVPQNEPETSFAWLELCRRLSIQYDNKYAFRAFAIPQGQLRPFSFQIFDDDTVHLGLRAYSPQKGTPTMSSAVMFKNRQIATRFKGEFIENWRALEAFDDDGFASLQKLLQGLTPSVKKAAMKDVDELLKDTV